jgi:hypothetical protein
VAGKLAPWRFFLTDGIGCGRLVKLTPEISSRRGDTQHSEPSVHCPVRLSNVTTTESAAMSAERDVADLYAVVLRKYAAEDMARAAGHDSGL